MWRDILLRSLAYQGRSLSCTMGGWRFRSRYMRYLITYIILRITTLKLLQLPTREASTLLAIFYSISTIWLLTCSRTIRSARRLTTRCSTSKSTRRLSCTRTCRRTLRPWSKSSKTRGDCTCTSTSCGFSAFCFRKTWASKTRKSCLR